MSTVRKVIQYPATIKRTSSAEYSETRKKRVAAYARVSTELEEQQTSFAAQVSYYTEYINRNENWVLTKIYTDEGISATNTKKRDGFREMIEDALAGKIDLIITKSVSRFARNTVDSLVTVRQLKEKGVEVFFEKENIYTFDSKGELLITIMSSLAQEESRSISENVTWGQRKRFADGKVSMPYKHFLGYEKGPDGQPKIVESEAKIVRLIYRMFLEGKTAAYIARTLTSENVPTPSKRTTWHTTTVVSILTNEKYMGDAVLQKTFTVDFLNKKIKVNEGEVPQYYVEDSHPAIVSKEVYDLVQLEFERRKGVHKSTAGCFSGKVICGDCGGYYGSKVWHSNSKYKMKILQCNNRFKRKCTTPHLTDEILQKAFIEVFNRTINNRDEIIETLKEVAAAFADTSKLDREITKTKIQYEAETEIMKQMTNQNAQQALDQEEFDKRYAAHAEEYQNMKAKTSELEHDKTLQKYRQEQIFTSIETIKTSQTVETFDESLFQSMVDTITVTSDQELIFAFKDGRLMPCGI